MALPTSPDSRCSLPMLNGRPKEVSSQFRGTRRTVAGAVFVLVTLAGLVLRSFEFHSVLFVALVAFAPYLMLGAPIALLLLLSARRWIAAVAAAVVLLLGVATQAALFVGDPAPSDSVRVTMMTANLRLGSADPRKLVQQLREHHVEVFTAQELTPTEVDLLVAAGLDDVLPYSSLAPRPGAAGVGVWSRYPLAEASHPFGFTFALVAVRVAVPGVRNEPTVLATHMAGPWPYAAAWSSDISHLPETLRNLAADNSRGAVLVGGDFNATADSVQFRALLKGGYRDAGEQSGSGYVRTYPGDTWFGPLIAIDHVLTRAAVATSAESLSVAGSDHRGLLVAVRIPRS